LKPAAKPCSCRRRLLTSPQGHSALAKRGLIKRLWELFRAATGSPDDQIVIGINEVPASQAMEMGQLMPEVTGP
jgi:phenylpyruvate tautomerase PptA (4-oxalocrotonate tautomerase family)